MFDKIVRHGTLMTVVVLIITLLGVLAALRIPVQMIPDLEVRTISVVTSWPGAMSVFFIRTPVISPD